MNENKWPYGKAYMWKGREIGVVQGLPVCFDAKECAVDTFALQNIHEHQVEFMRAFEKQGGIAFFLIFYSHRDELYYLPLR